MNTKRKTLFRFVFVTLTILSTAFCSVLWAQDCMPWDQTFIVLETQTDVDDFQLNHGPCDRVYKLKVSGPDIVNLDGLSDLTSVGYIYITDNVALTNIDGLSAIHSADDSFWIQGNAVLTNINGLSALNVVDGGLGIRSNAALTNINGLSALTSVANLQIWENSMLTNVDGLSALTSVGNEVRIFGNATLTNVDGLSALTSVRSYLIIEDNDALTNVDGLSTLASVHFIHIIDNDALTNVNGLSSMTRMGGTLRIENNDALTDVSGLYALTDVYSLVILNNNSLTNLDGLSSLTSMSGVAISGPVPNVDFLSNLTSLRGSISIIRTAITNLNGLSSLTSVGVNLWITENDELTNLDGLSRVTSVGGSLSISGNSNLVNLDGLSGVTNVGNELWISHSDSLTNLDGLSNIAGVGGNLHIVVNPELDQCSALSNLIDQWDDAKPGPGPGVGGFPDIGGEVYFAGNLTGCNSAEEIMATVNPSKINPGLNDAWYYPATSGQGFFITVFPDLGSVSLAWFTYDTELPPIDATANLGDPGHRWLTAVGPIEGNQVLMDIEMTSGGIFDSASEIILTDPPGSDGMIILTFDSCNSGTFEYDIPSINRQGIVPIQRVAGDNIALCEALNSD